jgi:hypothetical protein
MRIVMVLFPLQFCLCLELQHMIYLLDGATLWSRFFEAKKLQCHNMDILCIEWYFRGETITIWTIQVCVPHFKTPLAQCKEVILKISVKSGKHGTGSLCLAHLQDITSKTVPKSHSATVGLVTQISCRARHELSFILSFLHVHCPEKPTSCHILTSMLAPSFVITCLLLCLQWFWLA